MSSGKRLKEAKSKIEAGKLYGLAEAVALVKETSKVKFDASVELHIGLNIDAKKGDQLVRSTVDLPHGSGKTVRVAAFVTDGDIQAAKAAGADIVGHMDLIEEIKKTEKCDFDVAVAQPAVMKDLAAVARILGQKGLMPNPKTGTIADDVSKVIVQLKRGKLAYKNDAGGTVHVAIGKVSFDADKLTANAQAVLDSIKKAKPVTLKGTYIKAVYLASSMGPSIPVALNL